MRSWALDGTTKATADNADTARRRAHFFMSGTPLEESPGYLIAKAQRAQPQISENRDCDHASGASAMTNNLRLRGLRFRGAESFPIEVFLLAKADEQSCRARISPASAVEIGDRLRFGESSESMACLLGFLDADIFEKTGDEVLLAFHFTGAALDEALERLCQP
jgi:S-adenosylmethionine:tRNA ribosyltransferase-isomerase